MKIYIVHWKHKKPTKIPGAVNKRERNGKTEFLDAAGAVIAAFETALIARVQESDDGMSPEDSDLCFASES